MQLSPGFLPHHQEIAQQQPHHHQQPLQQGEDCEDAMCVVSTHTFAMDAAFAHGALSTAGIQGTSTRRRAMRGLRGVLTGRDIRRAEALRNNVQHQSKLVTNSRAMHDHQPSQSTHLSADQNSSVTWNHLQKPALQNVAACCSHVQSLLALVRAAFGPAMATM
jgi:hypothetical protein